MTHRTEMAWQTIGEQGAAADHRRHVAPAQDEAEIRGALAYHHVGDLDDPEITEQTPEARDAAIAALTRGYVDASRALAA